MISQKDYITVVLSLDLISYFYYTIHVIATKAKSQQFQVPNLEPLADAFTLDGGLAERLNATDCKSVNGARPTVQGFKSLTRRQIASPVMALTTTREMNRTAEAARSREISIRLLAVELKGRFHSDLSFLPNRMPEIR